VLVCLVPSIYADQANHPMQTMRTVCEPHANHYANRLSLRRTSGNPLVFMPPVSLNMNLVFPKKPIHCVLKRVVRPRQVFGLWLPSKHRRGEVVRSWLVADISPTCRLPLK